MYMYIIHDCVWLNCLRAVVLLHFVAASSCDPIKIVLVVIVLNYLLKYCVLITGLKESDCLYTA